MVQRKKPDKPSIPTETKKNYVKSDKRSSMNKTVSSSSSSSHQDIRNKGGTDLKKKLKKSRSLKLLDFENLESSSLLKVEENSRTCNTVDMSATPPKSSSAGMMKISENSPNYMKSTSSSNARKERLSVSSSRISQISFDDRNKKRRNSTNSKAFSSSFSPCGEKPVKSLSKKNSLKPVRTLTKTTSMKSVKPLLKKKNSGVVLNQNFNVGRATCSSTLKDSKFPDYLMINPGKIESEGTSVIKVCPYTYCSLNGHHHASLPPLKCFLSARRRSLRTQRSLRLKGLSPAGTELSVKTKKEIDTGQMEFNRDSSILKTDSIEETGMDFFVEIYAKTREDMSLRCSFDVDEQENIDVTLNPEAQDDSLSSARGGAEQEMEIDEKASKIMPNESSYSGISLEDIVDQNCEFPLTEIDNSEHNQRVEVEETEYQPCSVQAEVEFECCCIETSKSESIVGVETELDESVAEVSSDMEWEEGEVKTQLIMDGFDSSNQINGDILQIASEEKVESSDVGGGDSESHGTDLVLIIDLSDDQISFVEDSTEDQTATSEEQDKENDLDDFISSASSDSFVDQNPNEELTAATEENNEVLKMENDSLVTNFQLEDDEVTCSAEITYMNSMEEEEEEENNCFQDDAPIGPQLTETDQNLATSDITLDPLLPSADVESGYEGKEQVVWHSDENHNIENAEVNIEIEVSEFDSTQEGDKYGEVVVDVLPLINQSSVHDMVENKELSDKDQSEGTGLNISGSKQAEEYNDPENYNLNSAKTGIAEHVQVKEENVEIDAAETCPIESNVKGTDEKKSTMKARRNSHPQVTQMNCNNLKIIIGQKKNLTEENEELKKFNPRDPNYLPLELDPEAEKVDLKQQMIDERKNAEEWMVDYALQKAVNQLAPARKRRVALLVEAFETVTPHPKCESRIQHVMPAFAHARPMQACI